MKFLNNGWDFQFRLMWPEYTLSSSTCTLVFFLMTSGVDPGFSEGGGGGANGMHGHMAVARGRVPWRLLPCVLTFVAKFS